MNSVFSMFDFYLALPEIFLLASSLLILLLGLFLKDFSFSKVVLLSKMVLLTTFILVCFTPKAHEIIFQGFFIQDNFSFFMKSLVLLCAFIVLVISHKSLILENLTSYEYPILILFSVLGMMIMISAHDLISLFMGLELQSLSLYILASLTPANEKSSEAGMKYFVLGCVSTALLLYGCSLIYGYTGSTNFETIAVLFKELKSPSLSLFIGFIFLISGLFFKISAVPFHMWTPDVYEGVSTPTTTFLASVPKIAGFAVITRILITLFLSFLPYWSTLISIIAIISMVLGPFAALAQQNIKRILAYSAIGNIGYALMGLVVATEESVTASVFYISLYAIMIIGMFACLLHITRRTHKINIIDDIKGLVHIHPGTSLVFTFLLFSMAGIPPLTGFFGKFYIFKAVISAQLYGLAMVGVVSSVIAAAYYLWLIKAILIDPIDPSQWAEHYRLQSRNPMMIITLLGIVGLLMWIFMFPDPFIYLIHSAVASLFNI